MLLHRCKPVIWISVLFVDISLSLGVHILLLNKLYLCPPNGNFKLDLINHIMNYIVVLNASEFLKDDNNTY